MKKYRVTCGIFEGHVFMGKTITLDNEERIEDLTTNGRTYPAVNCEIVG